VLHAEQLRKENDQMITIANREAVIKVGQVLHGNEVLLQPVLSEGSQTSCEQQNEVLVFFSKIKKGDLVFPKMEIPHTPRLSWNSATEQYLVL
jgi:hypothetical protein